MNKTNIEHPTSNAEHRMWGGAGIRMKTPNPKTQISNKLQISISNREPPRRSLQLDVWDFFGAWGLGFGNFACDRQRPADHGQPIKKNLQPTTRSKIYDQTVEP